MNNLYGEPEGLNNKKELVIDFGQPLTVSLRNIEECISNIKLYRWIPPCMLYYRPKVSVSPVHPSLDTNESFVLWPVTSFPLFSQDQNWESAWTNDFPPIHLSLPLINQFWQWMFSYYLTQFWGSGKRHGTLHGGTCSYFLSIFNLVEKTSSHPERAALKTIMYS